MVTVSVQRVVTDAVTGDETLYNYSASAATEVAAELLCRVYASMVEYGMEAFRWAPGEMAFPKEQLYQFIQRDQLEHLEAMYPDAVATAYQNAMAYVQTYIGAMFDIDAMLVSGDTTSTALTIRLALAISTVIFLLAPAPQYAETTELHNKQLHMLLRGLKNGSRNFGRNAIAGEPNVRVSVVDLQKTGSRP